MFVWIFTTTCESKIISKWQIWLEKKYRQKSIPYKKSKSWSSQIPKTVGIGNKLVVGNVSCLHPVLAWRWRKIAFCNLNEYIYIYIYIFIYIFALSIFFKINLFIYFWLHWVFVAVCGLSLVAVSRGYSLLRCVGFSLRWLLLLRSTGSRHAGFSSCGLGAQ